MPRRNRRTQRTADQGATAPGALVTDDGGRPVTDDGGRPVSHDGDQAATTEAPTE